MSVDDAVLYSSVIFVIIGVLNIGFTILYFILTNKRLSNEVEDWITNFYNGQDEGEEDTFVNHQDLENMVEIDMPNGKVPLFKNEDITSHPLLSA